jgi:hypothetical protein
MAHGDRLRFRGNCFHFQETLKLGASYAFVINERNHLGLQPLHMSRLLLKRGKPGVRGQIVTDIQNALGRAGHPVPTVDGVYGQDTRTKNYFFSSSNECPYLLQGRASARACECTERQEAANRPGLSALADDFRLIQLKGHPGREQRTPCLHHFCDPATAY